MYSWKYLALANVNIREMCIFIEKGFHVDIFGMKIDLFYLCASSFFVCYCSSSSEKGATIRTEFTQLILFNGNNILALSTFKLHNQNANLLSNVHARPPHTVEISLISLLFFILHELSARLSLLIYYNPILNDHCGARAQARIFSSLSAMERFGSAPMVLSTSCPSLK